MQPHDDATTPEMLSLSLSNSDNKSSSMTKKGMIGDPGGAAQPLISHSGFLSLRLAVVVVVVVVVVPVGDC